ncbi:MAG: type ISP restriction/modification enzyme, partial [Candidatus Paceibacterota bacterium]
VVNFIVRAVDDILKDEFGLKDGLADTSKTKIKVKVPTHDKRYKEGLVDEEREVHKVQILDPATGTGTFLAEVVKQIYTRFEGQQGIWKQYVEKHLIPRLNGFEILMASYAMAHLTLDLLLRKTGVIPSGTQRFKVYLTNTLEEHHEGEFSLFAKVISDEANEANHIKRDTPVMVVLGNPPYSGESFNKGSWIMKLMEDYKKEPGGKSKLKERNPKWLNADENKFIRYGQYLVEKNGEGVLAFINPHGFIDNPTFRGMRWKLLDAFDQIFIFDLHGNSNKKEVSPDGSPDVNVFNILQGVSINFFVKKKKSKNELAEVYHSEIYGAREKKFDILLNSNVKDLGYQKIKPRPPFYFFQDKNYKIFSTYEKGFKVSELFPVNVLGFQTHRDDFAISTSKVVLEKRIYDFINLDNDVKYLKEKYSINESNSWKIEKQRRLIKEEEITSLISKSAYRPFDEQYVTFDKAINDRPRTELIQHVIGKENISLLCSRQQAKLGYRHVFIANSPANDCVMSTTSREANQVFPLYLYPEKSTQQTLDGKRERTPNLDMKIVQEIAEML